jgi:hypothetical protein
MYALFLAGNRIQTENALIKFDLLRRQVEVLAKFSKVIVLSDDESLMELSDLSDQVVFRKVPPNTAGALATASYGLSEISADEPFVIVPSNALILNDGINNFQSLMRQKSMSVGAITFQETNPLYSYARVDKFGNIIEITEKQVFGSCALAGVYYFGNKDIFINCVEWAMVNSVQTQDIFYISPALNYFLANEMTISLFEIPTQDYKRVYFAKTENGGFERNGSL